MLENDEIFSVSLLSGDDQPTMFATTTITIRDDDCKTACTTADCVLLHLLLPQLSQ